MGAPPTQLDQLLEFATGPSGWVLWSVLTWSSAVFWRGLSTWLRHKWDLRQLSWGLVSAGLFALWLGLNPSVSSPEAVAAVRCARLAGWGWRRAAHRSRRMARLAW